MLDIKQRVMRVLADIEVENSYSHEVSGNSIDCYKCGDNGNILVGRITFLDNQFEVEPIGDYNFLRKFEKCVLDKKKYGLRKTKVS